MSDVEYTVRSIEAGLIGVLVGYVVWWVAEQVARVRSK